MNAVNSRNGSAGMARPNSTARMVGKMGLGALALGAALAATGSPAAQASMITGSFSSPPASAKSSSTPIDISTGTAAWVYYGYNGTATDMNTDTPNSAGFTALASNVSISDSSGYIYQTFTGASPAASVHFDYVNPGSAHYFSFTTKLIAASETLNLYLTSYDSKSDVTATLGSGGSFTDSGVVLPYSPANDTDGTGKGHGYGVLTLNINGSIGDTLTFKDTVDITGVSTTSGANVGIQSADVVVPEPATLGLLAAGGFGLLLLGKRRRA